MITSLEIAWVAGLLEGEGCFTTSQTTPAIIIKMTDLDVIEKFRRITNSTNQKIGVIPHETCKTRYNTSLHGKKALGWMMTIYPLMGIRRREKIREIVVKWTSGWKPETWRKGPPLSGEAQQKNKAIKALMVSRKISREEARKILDNLTTIQ